MNWKIFAKTARLLNPTPKVRFRPNLDVLEDRTVLSPVTFHIVQNQSPLALSGTIAGMKIQEQGPGSLVTTYFGDFQTDIDEGKGAIIFTGTGNDFCSADSGRWAPLADGSDGTEPAAYGFQADISGTVLAAIRDFHWEADTGGSALSLYQNDDGSFGFSSSQTLNIHQGYAAYSHPTLGQGSTSLGSLNGQNKAGDGNLVDNGDGTLVLTIPVSFSISGTLGGMDYTLNFDGTAVGVGAFTGPRPGGRSHNDATIGAALVSRTHSIGTDSLTPYGTNAHDLGSQSDREVGMTTVETPFQVQDVHRGGTMAQLFHHPTGVALDQLTALDSVFQELA
ncbi:MAG TPA: hypothetical protein VGY77_11290 [Gemmataceae bacterium]|jgi:hypothetical protein|nr:hypothetical protein [Gemmataceae bacterium]